jgi:hypothetical protein
MRKYDNGYKKKEEVRNREGGWGICEIERKDLERGINWRTKSTDTLRQKKKRFLYI